MSCVSCFVSYACGSLLNYRNCMCIRILLSRSTTWALAPCSCQPLVVVSVGISSGLLIPSVWCVILALPETMVHQPHTVGCRHTVSPVMFLSATSYRLSFLVKLASALERTLIRIKWQKKPITHYYCWRATAVVFIRPLLFYFILWIMDRHNISEESQRPLEKFVDDIWLDYSVRCV